MGYVFIPLFKTIPILYRVKIIDLFGEYVERFMMGYVSKYKNVNLFNIEREESLIQTVYMDNPFSS